MTFGLNLEVNGKFIENNNFDILVFFCIKGPTTFTFNNISQKRRANAGKSKFVYWRLYSKRYTLQHPYVIQRDFACIDC